MTRFSHVPYIKTPKPFTGALNPLLQEPFKGAGAQRNRVKVTGLRVDMISLQAREIYQSQGSCFLNLDRVHVLFLTINSKKACHPSELACLVNALGAHVDNMDTAISCYRGPESRCPDSGDPMLTLTLRHGRRSLAALLLQRPLRR